MEKADLSVDYANGQFIPDAERFPDLWSEAARSFREIEHAIGRARLNQPYGAGPRQQFDLFLPAGKPKGLVVFVHGGYWMAFDRKSWSHLAAGATVSGWAVAMPSYTLTPDVPIAAITKEIATAIECAAELIAGQVRLIGHSAGGHLVARMNCESGGLSDDVARRLTKIVPISPLSDLRPLLQSNLNQTLGLTEEEANTESPVLCTNRHNVACDVWVGAEERPAFLDQAIWLSDAWEEARISIAPGRHHFDVIDALADPASCLTRALLD